ncbi:MAG: cytochrome c [Chloroflexi bacterium]|nr:cytochrome c [Chloroflexota bacterium]
MLSKTLFVRFIVLVLISVLLLSACAKSTPTPAPTATVPTSGGEGKNIYAHKCAVCHGPNGEGTAVGPTVAGHSIPAIKTQVRNPMGAMMAFPASQLSDHDLQEVAEFVAGLGTAKAQVQEWEKAASETMHLWIALLTIRDNDVTGARQHLQHALSFVQEPKQQTEIQKALSLLSHGDAHQAEHQIEELAGAEPPSGVTIRRLHLILAQRSIETKDTAEIEYQLGHFSAKANELEKDVVREALELVEKGDFHEAEHEIEELLKG